MKQLPASAGWDWVKRGFILFRQQPGALSILFLGAFFMMVSLGIIPVLGQIVLCLATPALVAAFSQACIDVERGERLHPRVLLSGFRSPELRNLLKLGMLYLLATLAILGLVMVLDSGATMKLLSGEITPQSKDAIEPGVLWMVLCILLANCVLSLVLYFSASLIYLRGMALGKALFYSVFGMLSAFRAFLVFLLAWFGIIVVVDELMLAIFGMSPALISVLLPILMVCTLIMGCSLFCAYSRIFEPAESESAS